MRSLRCCPRPCPKKVRQNVLQNDSLSVAAGGGYSSQVSLRESRESHVIEITLKIEKD